MISDLRSTPIMTLSLASSKSHMRDHFAILAGGHQRRFVHQVGQIGAGEARCAAGEHG